MFAEFVASMADKEDATEATRAVDARVESISADAAHVQAVRAMAQADFEMNIFSKAITIPRTFCTFKERAKFTSLIWGGLVVPSRAWDHAQDRSGITWTRNMSLRKDTSGRCSICNVSEHKLRDMSFTRTATTIGACAAMLGSCDSPVASPTHGCRTCEDCTTDARPHDLGNAFLLMLKNRNASTTGLTIHGGSGTVIDVPDVCPMCVTTATMALCDAGRYVRTLHDKVNVQVTRALGFPPGISTIISAYVDTSESLASRMVAADPSALQRSNVEVQRFRFGEARPIDGAEFTFCWDWFSHEE
jgi:hypothetical protein